MILWPQSGDFIIVYVKTISTILLSFLSFGLNLYITLYFIYNSNDQQRFFNSRMQSLWERGGEVRGKKNILR